MPKQKFKVKTAHVVFDDPRVGDYFLHEGGGIGGKPFPSESQAWEFGKAVKVLEHFMFMSYPEQEALLKQLEIK